MSKRRSTELWPPEWARLPNLDTLEALSRGEQPPEEQENKPSDTETQAKCQLEFTASPPCLGPSGATAPR